MFTLNGRKSCLPGIVLPLANNNWVNFLKEYMQNLKRLGCVHNFSVETAAQHREGAIIRDAFIAKIIPPTVRQRLQESNNFTLQHAFDKASSLEVSSTKC